MWNCNTDFNNLFAILFIICIQKESAERIANLESILIFRVFPDQTLREICAKIQTSLKQKGKFMRSNLKLNYWLLYSQICWQKNLMALSKRDQLCLLAAPLAIFQLGKLEVHRVMEVSHTLAHSLKKWKKKINWYWQVCCWWKISLIII